MSMVAKMLMALVVMPATEWRKVGGAAVAQWQRVSPCYNVGERERSHGRCAGEEERGGREGALSSSRSPSISRDLSTATPRYTQVSHQPSQTLNEAFKEPERRLNVAQTNLELHWFVTRSWFFFSTLFIASLCPLSLKCVGGNMMLEAGTFGMH